MAFRIIAKSPHPVVKLRRVKNRSYLVWVRQLPCVVTGRMPVDAAHISYAAPEYGAPGRGKSQKASDRWTLPLCREMHDEQHGTNEKRWWESKGIDPHLKCLVLWGLYCEHGDDALDLARQIVRNDG